MIKNPEGDIAYGDRIELTDTLRDGVVENMLVVLDNGSRLAAVKGTRFDNGNIELENAAYTPCPVEDAEGCPTNPSRSEEHTSELQSLMRISYAVFCLNKKITQLTETIVTNKIEKQS